VKIKKREMRKGLSQGAALVADAAEGVSNVVEQLREDEKLRARVLAATAAGLAVRDRAVRQAGMIGMVGRLATDQVLREQLAEVVKQASGAQKRVARRHRKRNVLLVLAGFGAASAAVAVPAVRTRVLGLVRRAGAVVETPLESVKITEEIEVDVPVSAAYNQWTQFEEFPQFMEGVDEVRQLDDTLLRWAASIGGRKAEWDAKIVEQQPDRRIAWESVDGKETRGSVTFDEISPTRSKVRLVMSYTPEGGLEKAGAAARLDSRRIRGDLERFKQLLESRGAESGAWRGEIREGEKTTSSA
jgi:uncharacterized membrane protein